MYYEGNGTSGIQDVNIYQQSFHHIYTWYDVEGKGSWKEIKSKCANMARALMLELLDQGRLADVKELIGEQKVTLLELDEVVDEGGTEVVVDEDT